MLLVSADDASKVGSLVRLSPHPFLDFLFILNRAKKWTNYKGEPIPIGGQYTLGECSLLVEPPCARTIEKKHSEEQHGFSVTFESCYWRMNFPVCERSLT